MSHLLGIAQMEVTMANKSIFKSASGYKTKVAKTDTRNKAGGRAYKMDDEHALAQYVLTGTLNNTFYASGNTQLKELLELSRKVSDKYIAQLAVYAREHGYMKDTPAFLCAMLAVRNVELLKQIFSTVIDNGKMLRNFVQIIRSGVVGRKSFGTAIKKLVQKWLNDRSDYQIFRDIVGNDPSLKDVIKMVRPRPVNAMREVLYAYITDKLTFKLTSAGNLSVTKSVPSGRGNFKDVKVSVKNVPDIVKEYELYKLTNKGKVPNVPFQMLTALNLGKEEWTKIAEDAKWMMTRMNINTFQRHGVFDSERMVKMVADRLSDPEEIRNARAFPYQLFTAYQNAEGPYAVVEALQDAMEVAIENVPAIDGKVYVLVDTSGSMGQAITGYRRGASSKTTCVDVAGLIAAAVIRKNPNAEVIPFDTTVHNVRFNPRDSVMTNAKKFARNGGGTDCSCAVRYLNQKAAKGDLIIMISDNESWCSFNRNSHFYGWGHERGTDMATEWATFKRRNRNAKMICLDIVANDTAQVKNGDDVLNIGGFSDIVFQIFAAFAKGDLAKDALVNVIKSVSLTEPNVRKNTSKKKIKVRKAH